MHVKMIIILVHQSLKVSTRILCYYHVCTDSNHKIPAMVISCLDLQSFLGCCLPVQNCCQACMILDC